MAKLTKEEIKKELKKMFFSENSWYFFEEDIIYYWNKLCDLYIYFPETKELIRRKKRIFFELREEVMKDWFLDYLEEQEFGFLFETEFYYYHWQKPMAIVAAKILKKNRLYYARQMQTMYAPSTFYGWDLNSLKIK